MRIQVNGSRNLFRLNIICFSDSHGRYLSKTTSEGPTEPNGLDRLITHVRRLRHQNERVLIVDNGDSIQGRPLVDLHDYTTPKCEDFEHPMSILHRELGVDCFVVGNHEFNFGLKHLMKIWKESSIPWLAANIRRTSSQANFFEKYRIFDFDGFLVGVLGLVTESVPDWESKTLIPDLEFRNVLETAEEIIPELRKECDFLIVAYHGGLERNPTTGEKWHFGSVFENQGCALWERFSEIDLLLTGHQHHSLLFEPEDHLKSTIIQPGSNAKNWAHVLVEVQPNQIFATRSQLVEASDYMPDQRINELLSPHLQCINDILRTPLGTATQSFAISDPMRDVWMKKHPMIQWINNLMCKAAGFDIAAISLMDASLPGLPIRITVKDVLEHIPFPDTVCALKIKGEILKSALEKNASFFYLTGNRDQDQRIDIHPDWRRHGTVCYNYDIWDGIEYGFNISKAVGKRLEWLRYMGRDVENGDELNVVLTSYRAAGGFFDMFSPDQTIQEFPVKITDLMMNDLLENNTLDIEPIQNFKVFFDD